MKIIVLQGVSGSGKSKYASSLVGAVVVSADQFFMEDGQYNFDPRKLPQAHQSCWRKFLSAMQQGCELIVVDNTNTTIGEISPYVLPAESFGYEVEILTIEADLNVAIQRNVHAVPAHVIEAQMRRMRDSWEQMPPWWQRRTYPNN